MSRQVDGDLTPEEEKELFSHLSECMHCSARFEIYKAMTQALAGLETEPPGEMARGVMYKIEKDKKRGFGGRRVLPFTGLAAIAAALLLIASGVFGNPGLFGLKSGSADTMSAAVSEATANALPDGQPESGASGDARLFAAAEAPAPKAAITGGAQDSSDAGAGGAEPAASPGAGLNGTERDRSMILPSSSAAEPEAPAVPFSQTFSAIVEVYGADDSLFSEYGRVQAGDQVCVFVPSDRLNAFIEDPAGRKITVFREGANIKSDADTGLVLFINQPPAS